METTRIIKFQIPEELVEDFLEELDETDFEAHEYEPHRGISTIDVYFEKGEGNLINALEKRIEQMVEEYEEDEEEEEEDEDY